MRVVYRRPRRRHGAAAVEFAFMLVLLMPILIGLWEVGRLVHVSQMVTNASREAGRQAATGEKSKAEIEQFVLEYLKANGLYRITTVAKDDADLAGGGKVLITIKIYDTAGNLQGGDDPKLHSHQNNKIEVEVRILFSDIEYHPTNFFIPPDFRVLQNSVWYSMKDTPITVNDTIPLS
jgi:hypothetical protein